MTFEDIQKANQAIAKMDIEGKEYAMVNERIKAFRQLYPEGTIETEIIAIADGIVTMKATVRNIDIILGTGHAQEKESSSYINETSYIENCETSAVGRALGMLGLGIDVSFTSYEEVANAQLNQQKEGEKQKQAQKKADPPKKQEAASQKQAQKKASPQKEASGDDIITAKHVTALQAYLDEHGLSAEKLCAAYQIDDLSQLNYRRHNAIINPDNLNGLKVSFGK